MFNAIYVQGKLKQMFPNIVDHTKSLIEVLDEYAYSKNPIHVKGVIERFAMDAIGSSAFGVELDTLHNKNIDFQQTVKSTSKVDWRRTVTSLANREFLRFFGFKTARHKVLNYFRDMVEDVTEYRTKNGIFRKDLFQYLLQLKNKGKLSDKEEDLRLIKQHKLTLNQMTTQCFSFFVGGFETSSALISLSLLEIALNDEIQEKLRENIRGNLEKHDGFTYESVKDMEYLEWVINGKWIARGIRLKFKY